MICPDQARRTVLLFCTPPPSCTAECTKRGVACDSCPVAASHGARQRPSPSDNCPGPVSRRPVALLCSSGSAPLSSLSPSLYNSPAQDSKPSSVHSQSELPSSCRHSNSTHSSLSLCVALSHVSDQHTLDGAVVCSSVDSICASAECVLCFLGQYEVRNGRVTRRNTV